MLTLDSERGRLEIEGKQTEFVPPTPTDMGLENAAAMLPVVTGREVSDHRPVLAVLEWTGVTP